MAAVKVKSHKRKGRVIKAHTRVVDVDNNTDKEGLAYAELQEEKYNDDINQTDPRKKKSVMMPQSSGEFKNRDFIPSNAGPTRTKKTAMITQLLDKAFKRTPAELNSHVRFPYLNGNRSYNYGS